MFLKNSLNIVGLLLTFIGVLISFKNSPINNSTIDGGSASTNHSNQDCKIRRKNSLMKLGVYIVLLGTAIQLVGSLIPNY